MKFSRLQKSRGITTVDGGSKSKSERDIMNSTDRSTTTGVPLKKATEVKEARRTKQENS